MICSYCKTETQNSDVCDFCRADLNTKRPQLDPDLDESAVNYTQPQLRELHTYDLMRLLRHIRDERSKTYRTMQIVRKAPLEARRGEYEDINEYGQQFYRELTAKKNVIEQILVDRMGYYPERVDDKLLASLEMKIERANNHERAETTSHRLEKRNKTE